MKKLLVLVVCFLLVLSLAVISGCNPTDDSDISDAAESRDKTDNSVSPNTSEDMDVSEGTDDSEDPDESKEYDPYDDYYPEGTLINIDNAELESKTPSELINKGMVKRVGARRENPAQGALPLVKWLFYFVDMRDIGYDNSAPESIVPLEYYYFEEIESFNLYHAAYNVGIAETSGSRTYSILFASSLDNPREYVLMYHDVYVDLTDIDVWNLVKAHEVFGSLLTEKPRGVSEIVTETVNIVDILGNDRVILSTLYYSENQLLIISTKDQADPRADIVDLSTLTIMKSQELKEPGKKSIEIDYMHAMMIHSGLWAFTLVPVDYEEVYTYALRVDDSGNLQEYIQVQNYNDFLEGLPEEYWLKSDSGRFAAYSDNNDIYIKDTQTNIVTMVYDSKPDTMDYEDIADIYQARMLYFVGDELYYNVYGWEWCWGGNSYNPITRVTTEYYRDLAIAGVYYGDYLYAYDSDYDASMLLRFLEDMNSDQEIVYDGKYFFNWNFVGQKGKEEFGIVAGHNSKNHNTLYLDGATVKVFDHETLKVLYEVGIEIQELYYTDMILLDDYVFVPVYATGLPSYDKAYVLKYR